MSEQFPAPSCNSYFQPEHEWAGKYPPDSSSVWHLKGVITYPGAASISLSLLSQFEQGAEWMPRNMESRMSSGIVFCT